MSEKLSVVIITLNEEKNIERCLDAAWQVADEVVVVDSFSTDKTKEICLERGVHFHENTFIGYIEQKRFAASLAKCNLILSIDADEVLSSKLINSILAVKQNPVYDAYQVNRLSHYVDRFIRHGHWFPDKKIRLFKKGVGKWIGRNPHDHFVLKDRGKTPVLKGVLYHYTFRTVAEHQKQADNFSQIGADLLVNEGKFFLYFKAILSPLWGFIYGYFGRLGFLDGWYGIIIASIAANETFLKYAKAIVKINAQEATTHDVVHISSMKTWRGGEQQVAYLVLEQRKQGMNPFLIIRNNSSLLEFCISNNFPHRTIKFSNGFNLFAAIKIRNLSKKVRAKTLHMHCSPSHTLGIFSKAFGNPSNLILSRRVIFPARSNFLSFRKFNYKGISHIICVSASIKEVMSKTVQDSTKLKVIYDGIDLNKFNQVNNSNLKTELGLQGKRLIGNISAISPEKDYYTFVNTAEKVIIQSPDTHFLIAGSGKDYNQIHSYILSKGLDSDITMLGFRNDVPDILSILDVFLITSKMEGLGSTILDAFASKVPVVATEVGGIPEIVQHEHTGLLSKQEDSTGLSYNVVRLLNDKLLADKITDNAYQQVSSRFSTRKMAELTDEVYKSV